MTRPASRLRVVVTGLIAQHPRLGGVAWDYVQYPAGLARLGHDVWYLEDSGEWPYRLDGGDDPASWVADGSANVRHLAAVMERAGLGGRWMYRSPLEDRWYGVADRRRREVLRSADLLVNVSGTLEDPGRYDGIPRLAYIDSDPVFTQARILADPAGAFARRVDAHDVTFSFGSRVADGPFATGHRWLPTRQPVVLSDWSPAAVTGDALTTVMSWTSYPPLEARGRVLGQKDAELRRLLTLPVRSPVPLEIALGSLRHAGWESSPGEAPAAGTPAEVLAAAGWRVRDAFAACGTPEEYRAYIRSSRGELSVAKAGYVTGRSGWFSCRSACYLACGRPVVVQDTGFAPSPPAGLGVLTFDSADTALAAIEAVVADPARHARAAREIAAEWFDAERVLGALVEDALGTGPPARLGAGA